MLSVIKQPRLFCPISKSRPVEFIIHTADHIIQAGQFAQFTINFQSSGAPDGEQITVNGQTFTTSSAESYSNNSFNASGSVQQTAQNFADALTCNYVFSRFYVFLSGFGNSWTVHAIAMDLGQINNWIFDDSSTTMTIIITENHGQEAELKDFRIWYQLFRDNIPLSEQYQAFIPFNPLLPFTSGRTIIELSELSKRVIYSEIPSYLWNQPFQDINFGSRLHLRFGAIELDENCNKIFGKAYKSSEFIVTNTVFQIEETQEFIPYCPSYVGSTKFLSNRSLHKNICVNSYEWVHVFLQRTAFFVGNFRVRYMFYNSDSTLLNINEFEIDTDESFYIIGFGTANKEVANHKPINTSYYTIQVFAQIIDEFNELDYIQYSELARRDIVDCSCNFAEVYFLEDKGSWRTIHFETIQSRTQTQQAFEFETPLDYYGVTQVKNQQLAIQGARYSEAIEADNVFELITERLNEHNRKDYEQFLRSPIHLIRTATETGQEVIRRVLIDRQNYTTRSRGEVTRLVIPFTFNTSTLVH